MVAPLLFALVFPGPLGVDLLLGDLDKLAGQVTEAVELRDVGGFVFAHVAVSIRLSWSLHHASSVS
jgi:hypothetical protein